MQTNAHDKVRAFIAVDMPTEVRDRIMSVAKDIKSDSIKVVGVDQIHITLFFLGYLDSAQIDSVKGIMSGLSYRKFEVSLSGVGTFSIKRPRVIFAEIHNGAKELNDIYEMMSDRLSRTAKLDERGFAPHVTIARLKRFDGGTIDAAKAFIDKYDSCEFGSFVCNEVKLKRSILTKNGALHSDMYIKELS